MTWPLATGLAEMWRCWLVKVDSPGSPDGYLLVDENDSWGEQNLGQLPNLINPNQPIAWLTRLFAFLPDMAAALYEPIPEWWNDVLLHLPPQPVSAPNAIGGGQILGTASNQMNIDDCLTAVWPAEVSNILGEFPDRVSLIAANNTLMGQGGAVTPNPTPRYNDPYIDFHATRGTHVWMAASRIAAVHPREHMASCTLYSPQQLYNKSWERSWKPDMTGDLLECLKVWLNFTMMPSEVTTFRTLPFAAQGGTLEDASVAQTVNDMLMTSHGHGLRLFPIWAALRPTQSASFSTLRAKGAFLVSASYDGTAQTVRNVKIVSEAGVLCRVLSPWSGNATISVTTATSSGDSYTRRAGPRGWFEFPTEAGGIYSVSVQQPHRDLKSDDEALASPRQGACDVTSFGAVGNNITYDTDAVATAISHCREAFPDGATVRFPAPGKYLIGQTNVTSNMTLFVEKGATIVGSPRKQDYPRGVPVYGRDPEYKPLIFSEGTVNVKILGSNGTIDGNGWAGGWYNERWKLKGWQKGPMMIGMSHVTGLEIANLTLRDGARWHVHPVWCKNVHVHDIHVFAPKQHGGHPLGGNDGIDPDSCRNVLIEDVYVDTGDDAISIKAVGPGPCTDVRIRRATLISRNFAVGEHTTGGISNILLEDSRIGDDQGSSAWGIKFKVPGTGIVENITLRRLTLGRIVTKSYYGGGGGFALSMAGDNMRNISITDVVAKSVVSAGSLEGSAASPLVGLVLSNITLTCEGSKPCRRFGCKDVQSSDFAGLSPVLRPKCHNAVADTKQELLGVDTSTWEHAWPQVGWECLYRSNISFALVEGYRSKADGSNISDFGGHVVTTAPQTVCNARAAGIRDIDLYHFPDTNINPAEQIHDTVNYFAAQNITFGKLWIDVEGPEYWNKSCSANVAFLHGLVAATQTALGHDRVGIYASQSQWKPIMCGDKSFSAAPLWYAHWDQQATFDDWHSPGIGHFGGWASPTMKQYSGSKRVCGINVDLDYRRKSVLKSHNTGEWSEPALRSGISAKSDDTPLAAGWTLAHDESNVWGRAHAGVSSDGIRFLGTVASWDACAAAMVTANQTQGPFNSLTWYAPEPGFIHGMKSPFDGNCFAVTGTVWKPHINQGVRSARGPSARVPPCENEIDCELNGQLPMNRVIHVH